MIGERPWVDYIFSEAPKGALGRDLYEHGEIRLDVPVYDPWLAPPAWRRFALKEGELQKAALLYRALRQNPWLRGERLRQFVAGAVKSGAPWVEVVIEDLPPLDYLPLLEDEEGEEDRTREGSDPEAPHWRTVPLPLQPDEERIPEPDDLPPSLWDWWERVREGLEGDEKNAHRIFRKEVRRNRLRLAWLEVLEACLAGGSWELSSLVCRVFQKPAQPRQVRDGKLVAGGVRISPQVFYRSLGRSLRPLWVKLILAGAQKNPQKARKLIGSLLDRELAKQEVLAGVQLPPLPRGEVEVKIGRGGKIAFDGLKAREKERVRDESWRLARALLRKGEVRAAQRVLAGVGIKLNPSRYFVVRDFPDLGLKIRHPRSVREALVEDRKLFFQILNLNGSLTLYQKRYLLTRWYPYARRLLFRLAGFQEPPRQAVPLPA